MGTVFFASDLHLGHRSILTFGNRSWAKTLQEHDDGIVERWNAVVPAKDSIVWVLGDVAFTPEGLNRLREMNGDKYLIAGNHDKQNIGLYAKYFKDVRAYEKKYGMILSHVPIHPQCFEFSWKRNVHGHLHTYDLDDPRYLNVNYDRIVSGCAPVSLELVRFIFEERRKDSENTVHE